jgi:hypothetical protein
MGGVGGVQHRGPLGLDELGSAVVDIGGDMEADPGVAVLGVVPAEEPGAEAVGVLQATEPVGELGPVLEGLELALAVGIVVARMRPAVALSDAEVGEQERDRLGAIEVPRSAWMVS